MNQNICNKNTRTMLCLFLTSILSFVAPASAVSNFAIARPFSNDDAPLLAESFDAWFTYRPCLEPPSVTDQPDLYLVYSRSFENDTIAQNATQTVELIFEETSGWDNCFNQIYSIAVDIEPDQDLYQKDEANSNVLWVNGPNRQFERTARSLQNNGVEIFYLMEMDSVPAKDYWLDELQQEIKNQVSDFAILGSKYRGDNWDSFYSQLPVALIHHINGNAIYNLTSPFFDMILEQLESEALFVENSVAFDYRISQILEQAKSGTRPSFPSLLQAIYPSTNLSQAILDNVDEITAAVRETPVLGNYAGTNMVPSYLDSREVILHGAKMRTSWDKEIMGVSGLLLLLLFFVMYTRFLTSRAFFFPKNMTLVVSDWQDGNPSFLLSSLDQSEHPFDRIIVMTPNATEFSSKWENLTTTLPVQVVDRQTHNYLDVCTAPVTTDWFMVTNSLHRIRKNLQVMTQHDKGSFKPVVPFVQATLESCYSYSSCFNKMEAAKQILPSADSFYQDNQFIFHTSTREEFCSRFENSFSKTLPPSATSYVAFLESQNNDSLYVAFDKSAGGFRDLFLRLPYASNSTVVTNSTNATDSCPLHTAPEDCMSAYCEWRDSFESCRYNSSLGIPTVSTQVAQVGQGGAFRVFNGHESGSSSTVSVQITSLSEYSANGTNIAGAGSLQQHFLAAGPEATSIEGVPAYKVTFHATVLPDDFESSIDGTILLEVYVLQASGTIGTDSERWSVSANDVKFNILLQDWSPQPSTDFIDVDVQIFDRHGQPLEGGDIPLSLSSRVQVDGLYEEMPAGYPMVNESSYTFRFPRFQSNATYDPVVGFSGNPVSCQGCKPSDGSPTPSASPSVSPTIDTSMEPSTDPTGGPTSSPSELATFPPSAIPSASPSPSASSIPSSSPSITSTIETSIDPTVGPTSGPSELATFPPSGIPSVSPTSGVSSIPSDSLSVAPTFEPSTDPSAAPTAELITFPPSGIPSMPPSNSNSQSLEPTNKTDRQTPTTSPPHSSPSEAPAVQISKESEKSDSGKNPKWAHWVAGCSLAVGTVLFLVMIVKSFSAVPDENPSGMRRHEAASLNLDSNSVGSIEGSLSLDDVDLCDSYLSEAGHFREVESGFEVAHT
eukprot:scaffold3070_cov128-Cylindrotheca_fusiformis.AAC.6